MRELAALIGRWLDRWIPADLRDDPRTSMRGRIVVGASSFGAIVSISVQSVRLSVEGQHWVPLVSWMACTATLILTPLVLRLTRSLAVSSTLVASAVLVGSLGVAVMEGGIHSPNAIILIIAPLVANQLGGWRSGATVSLVVVVCSAAFYVLHARGLVATTTGMEADTLTLMRVTMAASLAVAMFVLSLFYEFERDRSEVRLASAAASRQALERDLELTAAVQKLLMPPGGTLLTEHVKVAGVNVPASQASGDWWLCETLPDGSVRVVVGDATGHGPAPAMITAVVAGSYRALQEVSRRDATEVLEVLHWSLADIGASQYTMPLGVLDVKPSGEAHWRSAAAPPLLLLRADGQIETITAAGTPLGAGKHRVGERSLQLAAGDRLLVVSDGVLEMRTGKGRELGLKQLSRMLQRYGDRPHVSDTRDGIEQELARLRGDAELEDDLTLAVLEYAPAPSTSTPDSV